jgi:hypothetical protein
MNSYLKMRDCRAEFRKISITDKLADYSSHRETGLTRHRLHKQRGPTLIAWGRLGFDRPPVWCRTACYRPGHPRRNKDFQNLSVSRVLEEQGRHRKT